MLRVVRFAAKLGFEMEPEAQEMIENEGKLLSHVSPARLFEEVLKLFHGGAAYDTYLLLRKYGLFKYLFPFTDQCAIEDEDGMPERALQNTDRRVKQGKPVIPAFLFACMMWDPIRADAQVLMSDGAPESQAWRVAMNDGLRDQNQYVAVPRRLAEIILDIWNIHFCLIKSNPRMVKTSLNNRRFRAAYDFLLLRTSLYEVDEEIGEWWTRIQEVEGEEREAMISELSEDYKNRKNNRHGDGEANGNSVNYNERQPNHNRSGQGRGGQQGRSGGAQARGGRGKPSGRRHTSNGRGGGRKPYAGNDNSYSRSSGQNDWGGQRQGGHARSPSSNNHGTYQIGDQEINQKKVKVRRKRRVVAPEDRGDSDNKSAV
jgi:poly(A) polymerase